MSSILIRRANMVAAGSPTPGRLPAGYTELAWINDSGTAYINTGYVPVGDEVFEMNIIMTAAPSTGYLQIMGSRVGALGTSKTNCWLGINTSRTLFNRFGTVNPSGTITISDNTAYHITVDLTNNTTTANNEQYTFTGSSVSGITASVYVFRVHQGSGTALSKQGELTVSSYVVERNGVKQLELVPAMRDSDNEVGMYDLVSNTFLTNIGSGTFNYGTL